MVWKLLRQHISIPQFTGFFLANWVGMVIVLLGIQFYKDVLPVFTQGDSFIKKDFLIVSKKVSTIGSFVGKSSTFSEADCSDIGSQPFTKSVGAFLPTQFKVSASLGMQGIHLATDLFFESVPDRFVDIRLDKWHFRPGDEEIPIILPRNYLNLYNFGFAQSRNLPQLSEGMMGMVALDVRLRGKGEVRRMKGRIVGFSNRLNTLLVPEAFMQWANATFGEGEPVRPSRLIVEVDNPTDDRIAKYFRRKGYDAEGDKLDAGKTTWFLKLIVGIVLSVGLLISCLSFYILMLSIYLLLQKNTTKLENLLLIGFSPARVALPYQLLTVVLNGGVLALALGVVRIVRSGYLEAIGELFPDLKDGSCWPALLVGGVLCVLVSAMNCYIIRRKTDRIWNASRTMALSDSR